MSWSVHLGLAASLGNLHPTRNQSLCCDVLPALEMTKPTYASFASDLKLVVLEMHLIHTSMRGLLYLSVRFDQILLDRCLHPHMCPIIRHVLHVGIVDVNLTRPDPVGAVLPASDLIVVSRNIVTWSSATGASAAMLLGREFAVTGFHSASVRSFSLVLLWDFAWPASLQKKHFLWSSSFTFLDDVILASLPCLLLSMLFGCTPICTGTRLLAMYCRVLVISTFSFRTCIIQLVIPVLSQMRQASTRPSSILSTFTSVMMSSITVSGNCVGTSVFASTTQHVPQESNKPWLPFSHELPPFCKFLSHTCIADTCSEDVVHQRAERPVESRCRRFFWRRQFQLVPLVHGSEIWSQFE